LIPSSAADDETGKKSCKEKPRGCKPASVRVHGAVA
jgi:hypothetical protein